MNADILREDKILLYLFTIFVYSFSVTLMWYGLHVRRKSPSLDSANDINPVRSHLIQNRYRLPKNLVVIW